MPYKFQFITVNKPSIRKPFRLSSTKVRLLRLSSFIVLRSVCAIEEQALTLFISKDLYESSFLSTFAHIKRQINRNLYD